MEKKKLVIMYSRMVLDALNGKDQELSKYLEKNAENITMIVLTEPARIDEVSGKLKCAMFKSYVLRVSSTMASPDLVINECLMKFPEYSYEDIVFVIPEYNICTRNFLLDEIE